MLWSIKAALGVLKRRKYFVSFFECENECCVAVVTSARLRSIKASKKMIQELSSEPSTAAPPVPRHKLQLGLESLTRNIGGGWRLGAGDTAASSSRSLGQAGTVTQSLVKAANGQVYRMSVADAAEDWRWGLRVTPIMGAVAVFMIIFLMVDPKRGQADGSKLKPTSPLSDIKALVRNRSYLYSTGEVTSTQN